MNTGSQKNYLSFWIDDLIVRGKYSFTLEEARNQFSVSNEAVKKSLYRLSKEGKVISVYKGFYLIIPVEYRHSGILPPIMFIDSLMETLRHPYYVGLLTAAAQFGASHLASQVFFVITEPPVLRPIHKKGIHIEFVHTREFPQKGLAKIKASTGFVSYSNPSLTALDLVKFEKNVGRLARVVEVLEELQEAIEPSFLSEQVKYYPTVTSIQRLGFIFDTILENEKLAAIIYEEFLRRRFQYTKLVPDYDQASIGINKKWKLYINYQLTIES